MQDLLARMRTWPFWMMILGICVTLKAHPLAVLIGWNVDKVEAVIYFIGVFKTVVGGIQQEKMGQAGLNPKVLEIPK